MKRIAAVLLIAAIADTFPVALEAQEYEFTPEQMGGMLRRHLSAEPQNLNPLTGKDLYERLVNDYVFETLLERNVDTGKLQGVLAESWEVSDDGRVITFRLRPNLRFSDGHPLTAEDVAFSFKTVTNPEIDSRSLASYLKNCESCEAIDERTVRFTWTETYFKAVESSGNLFPILPKHIYEAHVNVDPEDPQSTVQHFNQLRQGFIGSGPYKFDEWVTGTEIRLLRNERYWGNQRSFDRIVFNIINETTSAVQALKAGKLDAVALSPEWYDKLEEEGDELANRGESPGYRLYTYSSPGNGYSFIGWNHNERVFVEGQAGVKEVTRDHPLFADRRVRLAMTLLINRPAMLEALRYGIGSVATGPFWPESLQYAPDLEPWPYDPKRAAALLAEAGWKDTDGDGWLDDGKGQRFEFTWTAPSGGQQTKDLVRVVSEEMRRNKIKVKAEFIDWSVFVRTLDRRDFDAVTLAWGGGGVESDPYQIWHSDQITKQGHNFIGFEHAEADRLIIEARRTLDDQKRNALYHRFHRLLHRQQPYTFLFARKSTVAVSDRMRGVKVHKLGMDMEEWWVPEDKGGAASP